MICLLLLFFSKLFLRHPQTTILPFAFRFLGDGLDELCTDQKMKITASSSIISWQIHGETMKAVTDFISLDSKITADGDCSCGKKKKKTLGPWKKSYEKPWQHTKNQRHYFTNKGLYHQTYGFSRSHEWMWELDHKESWAPKNLCFWTVVLDKILESPLDCNGDPISPS